jgi:DNA-binding MarR family transcriptional regulator
MHAQLTGELSRRLAADSSLSFPDYEVLVALTDHPEGRLRLYQLADRLGWEKSRLSHQVRRMAERGLVSRERCVDDRRGFFVATTPLGRREIAAAAPDHVEAVRALFIKPLTAAHLEAITSAAAAIDKTLNRAGR